MTSKNRNKSVDLNAILPFWRYVAKYIVGAAYTEQDEDRRKKLYEAARDIDMAMVNLGLASTLTMLNEQVEQDAAEFIEKFKSFDGRIPHPLVGGEECRP